MAKKSKVQTSDELVKLVDKIGGLQLDIGAIEADLDRDIKKMRKVALAGVRDCEQEIDQLFKALFTFAQENRDVLIAAWNKKSVKLPTGDLGWKLTKETLELDEDVSEDDIIDQLRKLRLINKFVIKRTKESIDKKKLLRHPEILEKLHGLQRDQREVFFVQPSKTKLTKSKEVGRITKTAS